MPSMIPTTEQPDLFHRSLIFWLTERSPAIVCHWHSIHWYQMPRMSRYLLSLVTSVAVLHGCTSYPSGTTITPGHFRFVTVSEPDAYGGGWREVCIHARMSQDIHGTVHETRVICDVGVGVPILLHTGRRVPLHEAQTHAAAAANAAAYATLTNTVGVSPGTCQKARRMMVGLLQREVPGARVHECRSFVGGVEIPVVNFP